MVAKSRVTTKTVVEAKMSADLQTIGDRIKLVRTKKLKTDQVSFASRVGVSAVMVSKWERDENDASEPNLRKLAEVADVPYEWLIEGRPATETRARDVLHLITIMNDRERDYFLDHMEWLLEQHFSRHKTAE